MIAHMTLSMLVPVLLVLGGPVTLGAPCVVTGGTRRTAGIRGNGF